MTRKRALLVGINQYHPAIGSLGGCLNDVYRIEQLLRERFSFSAKEIHLLTDRSATREAILDGLYWLIDDAKSGDVCIFFYAGHGTRLPNSMDPSGKDEALVAFSPKWETIFAQRKDVSTIFLEENRELQFIRDKEIKRYLNRDTDGVNVTLVMDCCHSGDIQRDIRSFPRYIEPPGSIQVAIDEAQQMYWQNIQEDMSEPGLDQLKLSGFQAKQLIEKIFLGNRFDFVDARENNILLAACSEKETALEKTFDDQRGGIFTHHLTNILSSTGRKNITHSEFMQVLGSKMRFTPQMPRLACPERYRLKPIFSSFV
jgi:hypothetical protein